LLAQSVAEDVRDGYDADPSFATGSNGAHPPLSGGGGGGGGGGGSIPTTLGVGGSSTSSSDYVPDDYPGTNIPTIGAGGYLEVDRVEETELDRLVPGDYVKDNYPGEATSVARLGAGNTSSIVTRTDPVHQTSASQRAESATSPAHKDAVYHLSSGGVGAPARPVDAVYHLASNGSNESWMQAHLNSSTPLAPVGVVGGGAIGGSPASAGGAATTSGTGDYIRGFQPHAASAASAATTVPVQDAIVPVASADRVNNANIPRTTAGGSIARQDRKPSVYLGFEELADDEARL
jgi:hypothetical protein